MTCLFALPPIRDHVVVRALGAIIFGLLLTACESETSSPGEHHDDSIDASDTLPILPDGDEGDTSDRQRFALGLDPLPEGTRVNAAAFIPANFGIDINRLEPAIRWDQLGYTTAVRDQGNVGTCTAFAAVAALESSLRIQTGATPDLAEQSLIRTCGNVTLDGYYMTIMDEIAQYPIWDESDNPYRGAQAPCPSSGGRVLSEGAYQAFGRLGIQALLHLGPAASTMDVYEDFFYYSGGLYRVQPDAQLAGSHAILLVGYDAEGWWIKNSWGRSWGDNGFAHIAYGEANLAPSAFWVDAVGGNAYAGLDIINYTDEPDPEDCTPNTTQCDGDAIVACDASGQVASVVTCQNGGTCAAPGECSCPTGWTGATCTTPVCTLPCQNGGTCSGPNTCSCPTGWTGETCSTKESASVCVTMYLDSTLLHRASVDAPMPPTVWIILTTNSKGIQNAGAIIDNLKMRTLTTNAIVWEDGFDSASSWYTRSGAIGSATISDGTARATADWGSFEYTGSGIPTNEGFWFAFDAYWASTTNAFNLSFHRVMTTSWPWPNAWLKTGLDLGQYNNEGVAPKAGFAPMPSDDSVPFISFTPVATPPTVGWHTHWVRVEPGQCAGQPPAPPPPCSPACQNGGTCSGPDTCSCPSGWSGTTCATPTCASECQNGGTCSGPNTCSCLSGWSGATCTTPVCASECQNGGTCSGPNTCSCPNGWSGATCSTPTCSSACQNGGTCSGPNTCSCPNGWTGASCTTPVCSSPCQNGGTCSGPDSCSCPTGWTGETCSTEESTNVCVTMYLDSTLIHRAAVDAPIPPTVWIILTTNSKGIQNAGALMDNLRMRTLSSDTVVWEDGFSSASSWYTRSGAIGSATISDGTARATADWGSFEYTGSGIPTNEGFWFSFDAYWASTTNAFNVSFQRAMTTNWPWPDAWLKTGVDLGQYNNEGVAPKAGFAPTPSDDSVPFTSFTLLATPPAVGWHTHWVRVEPGECAGQAPAPPQTCSPACQNGGICGGANTCLCPSGWSGATCVTPICASECQNGGTCIAPNTCSCPNGWTGATCSTPTCSSACQNGGTCTAPDTCTCPSGWSGPTCSSGSLCPNGSAWDATVGYCTTPWVIIPTFSGNQPCGPYYQITLPSPMNEFRPRASSHVSGGFLQVVNDDATQAYSCFSPGGQAACQAHLWLDSYGEWVGIRRIVGLGDSYCSNPDTPPPLATRLQGCGIYAFSIEGRALLSPISQ